MSCYEPLIAEVRDVVGRTALSYKDEPLAGWVLSGPIEVNEGANDVCVISSSMPSGRLASPEPDSTLNIWTPDRRFVVEMALRTASARAKRWIVDEQRLLPVPANWREIVGMQTGDRFKCELSIGAGWVDLLLAVDDWLIELGQPVVWSQIKQKMGSLRAYQDTSLDDVTLDVIDHAESVLSRRICETCGAPGRTRDRNGWYYTSCDEHLK